MDFRTLSGKWTKDAEGALTGVVDASASARALTGSEADQDKEVLAVLNLTKGKAAVIVNFTWNEDWQEWYLEMILDPTANEVLLDAVIRNADGTENTRLNIAQRDMELSFERDYNVKVLTKEIASGVFAVYGYVDGFIVVEAEDLADAFNDGMQGFECLGDVDDYTKFSGITILDSLAVVYCTLDDIKGALQIGEEDLDRYDNELLQIRIKIQAFVSDKITQTGNSVTVNNSLKSLTADLCAGEFRRRRATPTEENTQWTSGLEKLDEYIADLAESEIAFIVGEATS